MASLGNFTRSIIIINYLFSEKICSSQSFAVYSTRHVYGLDIAQVQCYLHIHTALLNYRGDSHVTLTDFLYLEDVMLFIIHYDGF